MVGMQYMLALRGGHALATPAALDNTGQNVL